MKEENKIDSKITEAIISSITESLFASGVFTNDDIKDKKSHQIALKRIIEGGGLNSWTIDHTKDLLTKGRSLNKNGEYDYARMFYATYFEHQINGLIHIYCIRKNIDQKTQTEIIKSVSIWGKFTWLLSILDFPKFNKTHLSTIKLLTDSRNSFIHYKWKDDPSFHEVPDLDKENKIITQEFENIEKAVKYFNSYCSKIMFKGKKNHIKKLSKR